jgi:quercetin dioxygenase-like cupin family protein
MAAFSTLKEQFRMKATVLVVLGCLILASVGLVLAQDKVSRLPVDQLKWMPEPDGLGFQTAIVEGDPAKPGLYIIQVKFPPHVMSRPHFHEETRYATVIKGTWYTGEGDEFSPGKTVALKPGSFMKHPKGVHHYDGAKDEEVILQLMGTGPSKTTRIDPSKGLFAPSR